MWQALLEHMLRAMVGRPGESQMGCRSCRTSEWKFVSEGQGQQSVFSSFCWEVVESRTETESPKTFQAYCGRTKVRRTRYAALEHGTNPFSP